MSIASPSAPDYEIVPGAIALPHGLLFLRASATLIAADIHLGYEDVIGGALPLWSTATIARTIGETIERVGARELVLLGDVVHSTNMSEGAARTVRAALDGLRAKCTVVPIAGNHESHTRGRALLGETYERLEREGWLLLHGDVPPLERARCIVGHLHPSLRLGAGTSVPVMLGGERVIVAPALTPYSPGLDVRSRHCARALLAFGANIDGMFAVACGEDRVYPFGSIGRLRVATRTRR
ncbi:MAG: metallophosphoesterase [Candidatus Eremiobacteraeota bacterium]|nr:metallophosphoesterase [Candidatus Eremiobacteraeota bacterium]